jgi:hypothetical protein
MAKTQYKGINKNTSSRKLYPSYEQGHWPGRSMTWSLHAKVVIIFLCCLLYVNVLILKCVPELKERISAFHLLQVQRGCSSAVGPSKNLNRLLAQCSTTGKPTRSFATERVSLDSV